jgi:hypothetical protein
MPYTRKKPEWPLEALVVTMRNARQANNWGGTEGSRALAAQNGKPPRPPDGYEKPVLSENEPLYPFTKGIDLANDGLGYGEETSMELCFPDGCRALKRARRTRTGSLRLSFVRDPTRRAPALEPSPYVERTPPPNSYVDQLAPPNNKPLVPAAQKKGPKRRRS